MWVHDSSDPVRNMSHRSDTNGHAVWFTIRQTGHDQEVTILDRFTPIAPIERVHHARDDLHAAAAAHCNPLHGSDFAAYGSALTGAVAALSWLTANLLDQLEDSEDLLIRSTEHKLASNDAVAHLSCLRTLLNAATSESCGYWESISKVDQNSPGPAPTGDPHT